MKFMTLLCLQESNQVQICIAANSDYDTVLNDMLCNAWRFNLLVKRKYVLALDGCKRKPGSNCNLINIMNVITSHNVHEYILQSQKDFKNYLSKKCFMLQH